MLTVHGLILRVSQLSTTHLERGNNNGRPDRKLIKSLMGSADDLSSLLAYTHYLYVGITRMGASAA